MFLMRRFIHLFSIASALVCALLTLLVASGRFVQTDFDFTARLQPQIPVGLDPLLTLTTELGSIEFTSVVFGITLLRIKGEKREKGKIIAGFIGGLCIILLAKNLIHHPAPPVLFHRATQFATLPSSYVHTQYSYPSGHMYRFVFVSILLLNTVFHYWRKRSMSILVGSILFLNGLLAIGLIVLGKHWMTDAIGGATLAGTIAGITVGTVVRFEKKSFEAKN